MQAVFKSYQQILFPIAILMMKHENLLSIKECLETGSELPTKYIHEIYAFRTSRCFSSWLGWKLFSTPSIINRKINYAKHLIT